MKIVFFGTGDIGLPSLKAIQDSEDYELLAVYTQPDRPYGRKGDLKISEIKLFAESCSIPVHQPEKIKEIEAVQSIVNFSPDIIVVIAVSYTHLRAHETGAYLVCRLLLEKKK